VDDILALVLALAAKPEELEVLMISVTYGNVEVKR
jgi:inosine-uridine nucleoside N-ribohydrolase